MKKLLFLIFCFISLLSFSQQDYLVVSTERVYPFQKEPKTYYVKELPAKDSSGYYIVQHHRCRFPSKDVMSTNDIARMKRLGNKFLLVSSPIEYEELEDYIVTKENINNGCSHAMTRKAGEMFFMSDMIAICSPLLIIPCIVVGEPMIAYTFGVIFATAVVIGRVSGDIALRKQYD